MIKSLTLTALFSLFVFFAGFETRMNLFSPVKGHAGSQEQRDRLNEHQFIELMIRLAKAWSRQDLNDALSCFTEDAVYMEPPDIQLFKSHDELRPYFGALKPGTYMKFHNLWFNENQQIGAGEYSFGNIARPNAVHGVAVVEIKNGRIRFWREYQRKGSADFKRFIAKENKQWEWHIGNYPPKK